MNKIIAAAILAFALTGVASAHPGGHDFDDRPKYRGYDCSAMAGEFDTAGKRTILVTVFEGKVIFAPKDGMAAVGNCVAPLVAGDKFYPRAQTKFDASFGKELGVADCCTVQLKDDALMFDRASTVVWKRRKP